MKLKRRNLKYRHLKPVYMILYNLLKFTAHKHTKFNRLFRIKQNQTQFLIDKSESDLVWRISFICILRLRTYKKNASFEPLIYISEFTKLNLRLKYTFYETGNPSSSGNSSTSPFSCSILT